MNVNVPQAIKILMLNQQTRFVPLLIDGDFAYDAEPANVLSVMIANAVVASQTARCYFAGCKLLKERLFSFAGPIRDGAQSSSRSFRFDNVLNRSVILQCVQMKTKRLPCKSKSDQGDDVLVGIHNQWAFLLGEWQHENDQS